MNSEEIFCAAISYRRRRSRTPCAAMTATSWCSALLVRRGGFKRFGGELFQHAGTQPTIAAAIEKRDRLCGIGSRHSLRANGDKLSPPCCPSATPSAKLATIRAQISEIPSEHSIVCILFDQLPKKVCRNHRGGMAAVVPFGQCSITFPSHDRAVALARSRCTRRHGGCREKREVPLFLRARVELSG
jgi:hypothetical protein